MIENLILHSRERTHDILFRGAKGDCVQNNIFHQDDNMLDLYVPDLELDEYENSQTIPKHKISCAKDLVLLAGLDKSGLFLTVFLLSNFYLLIDYTKKHKLKYFVEKFNLKSRELFEAKYSGRSDFSQHKFIATAQIRLFRGLLKGSNCQKFWQSIIKKIQNSVVKLTQDDERVKNVMDEMPSENSLIIASRLGVEYKRACTLVKVLNTILLIKNIIYLAYKF